MTVSSLPLSLSEIEGVDWDSLRTNPCRVVKQIIRGYDNSGFFFFFQDWVVEVNRDFLSMSDGKTTHSFPQDHDGYGWVQSLLKQNPHFLAIRGQWDDLEFIKVDVETHNLRKDQMTFHT